jgi:hypothetical protein
MSKPATETLSVGAKRTNVSGQCELYQVLRSDTQVTGERQQP